jgi:transposase
MYHRRAGFIFDQEDEAMRVAVAMTLTPDEQATLQHWARGPSVEARRVLRAKIVLAAATGRQNKEIADELGTLRKTVALWRNRFAQQRLAGIEKDAPRGGRPSTAKQKLAARIVKTTTTQTPPAATHWSTRTLAAKLGTSPSMVQRVWKETNLQPHRVKTFKLSRDAQFAEKLVDVVGLYLNPPEHAIVLCVDEKTQIQAHGSHAEEPAHSPWPLRDDDA